MVGFPAAVERYNDSNSNAFSFEDPLTMDVNALEPTSGRKLWKLKHGKRIKKPMKAEKSGFRGAAADWERSRERVMISSLTKLLLGIDYQL